MVLGGVVYLEQNASEVRATALASLLANQFTAHDGGVSGIALANGDAWIVTTGNDATLKVWSRSWGGSRIRTISLDHGPATAMAVQGNVAVTGHEEGEISVWNLADGRKLAAMKRNDARIWALRFVDGDTAFAVAAHDWSIAIWNRATPTQPTHVFEGHKSAVQSLAYDPADQRLISGSADKTIRAWNLRSLSFEGWRRGHDDFVSSIAMASDGSRFASGDLAGRIRIWTSGRKRLRRLPAHQGPVTGLVYLPGNRRLASASEDGRLMIWDVRRGRRLKTFGSEGIAITALAVTDDGRQAMTAGADGAVRVWNIGADARGS